MVSEKNNRVILRGKIFFREIAEEKKSYTEKKYLSWRIMWKKSLTHLFVPGKYQFYRQRFGRKKILTQTKSPILPASPPPPPQKNGRSLITLTRPVIYQNSCCISFQYIITCCSYFPRFLDVKDLPFK